MRNESREYSDTDVFISSKNEVSWFSGDNEKYFDLEDSDNIYDILVGCNMFKSKNDARKNWSGIKELTTTLTILHCVGSRRQVIMIHKPNSNLKPGLIEYNKNKLMVSKKVFISKDEWTKILGEC